MDLAKKLSSSFTSQSWPPGNQPRLEIYTVIADAKIRELRETMASPSDLHRTSNVIHFSDGTIDLDDILEDDESEDEEQPVVDPKTLSWAPWLWFQTLHVGGKAIEVCDFLGEHLADFFGITTPKYQLEIEERLAILDEEKREQLQAEENRQHWSGRQEHIQLGPRLDAGDLGQDLSSQLEIVSEQPCTRRGEGDIPPNSAVSFQKKP